MSLSKISRIFGGTGFPAGAYETGGRDARATENFLM
jgi:hypothetical protein